MLEKYLHYLWRYKLVALHKLKLHTGEPFKVLNYGDYNSNESGPDFLNGKVEIGGIVWAGNIELHVKSRDWYLHKHHKDSAYNTVVLHVVYEFNGDVMVNDQNLPTLVLKPIIDSLHYQKYLSLFKEKKTILCGSLLKNVPDIYMTFLQEKALVSRLNRKTAEIKTIHDGSNPKQVLYFLLARAMGSKINQMPFEELTHKLPLHLLKKYSSQTQIELLQTTSGIFIPNSASELIKYSKAIRKSDFSMQENVAPSAWKFCGARPTSSPIIRIKQFAVLVEKFDFEINFIHHSVENIYAFILGVLDLNVENTLVAVPHLSKSFKDQLIVNCFVPFIFWIGNRSSNSDLIDKAFALLNLIEPESNTIIKKWNSNGIFPKNAGESQALLEIYNEFCSNKKCIGCEIGIKLLER